MARASSQVHREPVLIGSKRVTGCWQRTNADGSLTYEWQGRVAGKVKRVVLQATTRSEAAAECQAMKVDVVRGVVKPTDRKARTTVVRDEFLDHLRGRVTALDRRKRVSERTLKLYEQRLSLMVERLPAKLADVEVRHVVNLINRLEAEGRAPATVTGYTVALSSMLDYARRAGYISLNPARLVEKEDRPGTSPIREKRFLSAEQIDALLEKLSPESMPVAATMAFGALRISETLGLRWADVDLKGGALHIRGQAGVNGSRVQAKTTASEQAVPLVPRLQEILRLHRERVATVVGLQAVQPERLVFSTRSGKAMHRRNAYRAVESAAERAGLGKVGLHDLRRSCLSQAVRGGVSLAEASRLARHTSVATTARYIGDEQSVRSLAERLVAAGVGGFGG